MIQIIRTKGYKFTTYYGKKLTLLPVKKDEFFKGIIIGDESYSGTFILHETPAIETTVQYRLDDTVYPFSEEEAKSGDVFKHKDAYYMWINTIINASEKINSKGYIRFAPHPAVYDFKKRKLVNFTSLDINYPMIMVKLKVCGDNNIKSKSVQRKEAVQRGE